MHSLRTLRGGLPHHSCRSSFIGMRAPRIKNSWLNTGSLTASSVAPAPMFAQARFHWSNTTGQRRDRSATASRKSAALITRGSALRPGRRDLRRKPRLVRRNAQHAKPPQPIKLQKAALTLFRRRLSAPKPEKPSKTRARIKSLHSELA